MIPLCGRALRVVLLFLGGGNKIDTAPIASGQAKEKAGHRTRSASRLSLVTLQNTLIMVNQTTEDKTAMIPLSAVSSGAIYIAIVTITLRMLRQGLKRTKTPSQ